MGDLFSSLGGVAKNVFDIYSAKNREKQLQREAEERRGKMNFDPAYASEIAPQYKTTESPVARAYLESFLTGDNADAIQGTRAGSGDTRRAAARSYLERYGSQDDQIERGRAERTDPTRFAVNTPDRYAGESRANYALMGNDHSDELADEEKNRLRNYTTEV